MKTDDPNKAKCVDENARFYVIFDELSKAEGNLHADAASSELDEIEQVMRMIVDVDDEEPPRFMTST
jgi:hypothetical protein